MLQLKRQVCPESILRRAFPFNSDVVPFRKRFDTIPLHSNLCFFF